MRTHHALQSLGELISLKHILALLVFGAVHHLRAIIHCLLWKRKEQVKRLARSLKEN